MSEERIKKTTYTILGFVIAIVIFFFSGSMFWGVLIATEILIIMNFISSEKRKSDLIQLLIYSLLTIAFAIILQFMFNK